MPESYNAGHRKCECLGMMLWSRLLCGKHQQQWLVPRWKGFTGLFLMSLFLSVSYKTGTWTLLFHPFWLESAHIYMLIAADGISYQVYKSYLISRNTEKSTNQSHVCIYSWGCDHMDYTVRVCFLWRNCLSKNRQTDPCKKMMFKNVNVVIYQFWFFFSRPCREFPKAVNINMVMD